MKQFYATSLRTTSASMALILILAACTQTVEEPVSARVNTIDSHSSLVKLSDSGHYQVSIGPDDSPVLLNQIHSWTINLRTKDGDFVEGAHIKVYGGMPKHKHALPTKPEVTDYSGAGNYRIEGVKFSMPGEWQLGFAIDAGDVTDQVEFYIEL